ncbi:deoxynucleotide monophosphate kinase family protein [Xylophilus sp.]|uniref:deoxynucleotide monophosphate kinase family protein n=1 Tax=Xylophilus sp. TaxID=2653893 RepID=UPI0013BBD54B|nr:deoxynucleotide monophosphate kinase [Xylophilus sp.]KAF1045625.1 MAG: Cytidylate kinase [Xylophilus sp.]
MLIGIAGPKRSGKTTLAEGLCQVFGLEHLSFAGPIRAFVASILGWSLNELEASKEEQVTWLDGITPRQMMQTVGTEWGRQMVHDQLWVRSMLARIPDEGGVISDVRFENEAKAILDMGGVVIQLSRPGTGAGDGHASEVPLPDDCVTHRWANDGSAHDLIAAGAVFVAKHYGIKVEFA